MSERLTEKVRYERYHKELQELRDSIKRNPSSLNCAYDTLSAIKTYEPFKLIYEKLWQLEDIEEKLGIDLIPLLTALSNGYVFWKYDDFIYKVEVESITNCGLKVNTWYYASYNKNGKQYGNEFSILFKEYGKNWALTREELENEK